MAEDLGRLKKKRGVIRAGVTRVITAIENEMAKQKPDMEAIEALSEQMSIKWTALKELDQAIEPLIERLDELATDVETAIEYEDKLIMVKTKCKKYLNDDQKSSRYSTPEPTQRQLAPSMFSANLPKLEIRKFDGNSGNWQEFWSKFEAVIESKTGLSDVEKFGYLKSFLTGTAETAVSGLLLTEANYVTAKQILKDRFGRTDMVISAHMHRLLSLQPVRRSADGTGLRKLYDECHTQIKSLEALQVTSGTYGTLLCPIIVRLLPHDIALGFTRKNSASKTWEISALMDYLKSEIESRETASAFNRREMEKEPERSEVHRKPKPFMSTASALSVAKSNNCPFCGKEHKPEDCKLSLEKKKNGLRRSGRCYICLGEKHVARKCRNRDRQCTKCGRRHHDAICDTATQANPEEITTMSIHRQQATTLLPTATAKLNGPNGNITVRILLDSGSHRTFVLRSVVRALHLESMWKEDVVLHSFGDKFAKRLQSDCYGLSLMAMDGNQVVEVDALEVSVICNGSLQHPNANILTQMKASDLQAADRSTELTEISILIGSDFYWKIVSGQIVRLAESLVTFQTIFGWAVQGPVSDSLTILNIGVNSLNPMNEFDLLPEFWKLDTLGIHDTGIETVHTSDEVLREFNSSLKYDGQRYTVSFPWNSLKPKLLSNYEIANKRFRNLLKRFQRDKELFSEYSAIIEDQLKQGVSEVVPAEDICNTVYYMPHSPVIRRDKVTTKVRVVFDASSHGQGSPSLNDCLEQGPNLNPNLLDVLVRFRKHKVALTADVKQAFLQIVISEEDRDATRFLWFDGDLDNPIVKELRMCRVLFGARPSPFLLAATLRSHFQRFSDVSPKICQELSDNMYVDDYISGAESSDVAVQMFKDASNLLEKASMNLCKWTSNCKTLEADIGKDAIVTGTVKVLGIPWNLDLDILGLESVDASKTAVDEPTKRLILQCVGRLYDPLGLISPFTITARILFQKLWTRKIEWDDSLPLDLKDEWNSWSAQLPNLSLVQVPRYYLKCSSLEVKRYELHAFSDASEVAYGAVVYLKAFSNNECLSPSLVASKGRVTPLRKITVPRLELLGALVAARLVTSVRKSLGLSPVSTHMWTDSTIVLHWIRGTSSRWKTFVANRVSEILDLTAVEFWNHCPGKCNPADLVSRGVEIDNIVNNDFWWKGPNHVEVTLQPELDLKEVEKEEKKGVIMTVQMQSLVINVQRFSRLRKLLRVTAYVLRFISSVRNRKSEMLDLSVHEIETAEALLIKLDQRLSFPEEIKAVEKGKELNSKSKLCNFDLFLEEGILRLRSRIQAKSYTASIRNPIILSADSHLTKLIVLDVHERLKHSGTRDTMAELRERFWILRSRQVVKSVLHRCILCQRYRVKATVTKTGPLPDLRVEQAIPFSVVGVDFAGPVYVKEGDRSIKTYIVLFTCAITRGVHLEHARDMTTETFLLALRRMFARRGVSRYIYSDNAKTFKKAKSELESLWLRMDKKRVSDFLEHHRVVWRFIVERAPWWGGYWERMVRSTKMVLKKVLMKSMVTFDEMTTILTEAESIINSRPIAYSEDENSLELLTPSHLISGRKLTMLPDSKFTETSACISVTKRWKYLQNLLSQFWQKWYKDYLLQLKSAHEVKHSGKIKSLDVNDVVLLKEDNIPRQCWKVARVVETFDGRDGTIRSCMLQLPNGSKLKRPIQLLYRLETSMNM